MLVWIISNVDAGRSISNDALRVLVTQAGHTVVDLVNAKADDLTLPRRSVDLVAAAGGDGTAATAARLVAGTPIPFAILPLGTANNIAASLDMSRDVPQLIASWERADRTPFDLARARTRSKEWTLVEGVGGGLLPSGIAAAKPALDYAEAHPSHEVAAAVRVFSRALKDLPTVRRTLIVDGKPLTRDLLMFEVLNIRSVGPNLVFAPNASPSDGMFDVITAGPEHRTDLLQYFESRSRDNDARLILPHYRARHIRMDCCEALHIDDEVVDVCGAGEMDITVMPGAATILV